MASAIQLAQIARLAILNKGRESKLKGKVKSPAFHHKDQIVQLYLDGITFKRIAKQLSFAPRAVRNVLISAGVWSPRPNKCVRLTDEDRTRREQERIERLEQYKQKMKADGETRAQIRAESKRLADERKAQQRAEEIKAKPWLGKGVKDAFRIRYNLDPTFRMTVILRARLRKVMTRDQKSGRSLELLGCTAQELKEHIEKQFTKGMTWENQGEWHVDHIIPCAAFDMDNPEHHKRMCHFSNLRPMWGKDNMVKSNKELPSVQMGLL